MKKPFESVFIGFCGVIDFGWRETFAVPRFHSPRARAFPSQIPSALRLTLLRSSTSLRSVQDDTTEKHEP